MLPIIRIPANWLIIGIILCVGPFTFSLNAAPITITVAKGFVVSLYASGLGDAKQLAIGDKGTLFVGSSKSGLLTALVDRDNNGQVDYRYTISKNLYNPDALAFYGGDLYVAIKNRILRYPNIESRLKRPIRPVTLFDGLPNKNKSNRRVMAVSPEGKLYIAIAAGCNVCLPSEPLGGILEINTRTGEAVQVATGVRKVLGMDWSPTSQKLWFSDNGRDWMGDNLPPDEINLLEKKGAHFGFPYIHGNNVVEPRFKQPPELIITKPIFELPAHVTPVGVHFYRGKQFPKEYHNQLFVAENGSTNRSSKVGYQLVKLNIENEKVTSRTPVISFLDGEFPVAKPHSLVTAPDGAMFISDDYKGNIYRLYYKGSK